MSMLPVITLAAVCAATMGIERWRVRSAAVRRISVRRRGFKMVIGRIKPRSSEARPRDPVGELPAFAELADRLDHAVLAADVAWIRYDRFPIDAAMAESPFQLRRRRVESSVQRYASALQGVQATVHDLLAEVDAAHGLDEPRRHALERLVAFIGGVPPTTRDTTKFAIEASIAVLENTLAVLGAPVRRVSVLDPFRR